MHLPEGISGWTVFATGLLVIAYRIHGIDAPRPWVEWVERRFLDRNLLRLIGGALLLVAGAAVWFADAQGIILWLLYGCAALLALVGVLLLLFQNHARHLVLATAEANDGAVRIWSIVAVVLGLALAVAPFFY